MIELIERFESFTTSVTKAYKCIQKIKLAETERMGLKANHVMYIHDTHLMIHSLVCNCDAKQRWRDVMSFSYRCSV